MQPVITKDKASEQLRDLLECSNWRRYGLYEIRICDEVSIWL